MRTHDWHFEGDDPYIVCADCGERRDALTDRMVTPVQSIHADDTGLEDLARRYNTVVAIYHDAYAEWEVRVDGRRVLSDDCSYQFWGTTIGAAVRAAMAFEVTK